MYHLASSSFYFLLFLLLGHNFIDKCKLLQPPQLYQFSNQSFLWRKKQEFQIKTSCPKMRWQPFHSALSTSISSFRIEFFWCIIYLSFESNSSNYCLFICLFVHLFISIIYLLIRNILLLIIYKNIYKMIIIN